MYTMPSQPGAAGFDLAAVDIDLVLDSSVEGIAEALTDQTSGGIGSI